MSLLQKFKEHITKYNWQKDHVPLLIACSGGLDSVTLVHLCVALDFNFAIAHCNFKLRGSDSDADEALVRHLGEAYGKKTFVKPLDTEKAVQHMGGSVQMVARTLRYDWFHQLTKEEGFDFVLTAHHADDNLETFLINLSRSTGLSGLTGIPEQNGKIVRPLLPFSKEEIHYYAKKNKLKWREDASNLETKYLRNKIRHEVVPKLKELHPNFLQNFENTLNRLSASEEILNRYKKVLQAELFENEGEVIQISLKKLKKHKPDQHLLYLLFSEFGFTQWKDILHLIDAESGKELQSRTHRLLKDRDFFLLTRKKEETGANSFLIEEAAIQLNSPLQLRFEETKNVKNSDKDVIFIDKDKLKYPLTLRKWQKGDWFIPYGMQGKKKVSKFLKDEKIDNFSKESVWLLCSNKEVVWVVGMRADDRFKVLKNTKKILRVKIG